MKKNVIYMLIGFGLFVALKFIYSYLDTNQLLFLLKPTNMGVSAFTGAVSVFKDGVGYFYPQLNIVINKSCSGYTFWLICFLMTTFVLIQTDKIRKLLTIPIALVLSFLVTILANISRICGYIWLMKRGVAERFDADNTWLHESEGIFVYLSFLIIFYFILNTIINKKTKHEEFT